LRRRRSARRAGARPGAGVSADDRRGARHRRDADARREGEHKQVVVEDLLGPEAAVGIIAEALQMYKQLRRGQLAR